MIATAGRVKVKVELDNAEAIAFQVEMRGQRMEELAICYGVDDRENGGMEWREGSPSEDSAIPVALESQSKEL